MRPTFFGYRTTKKTCIYLFLCCCFPDKKCHLGDDVIKETLFNVKGYYLTKSLQSEIEDKEITFDDQLKQYIWENMCNTVRRSGRRRREPANMLPQTKHKIKVQAWSSLFFHCRRSSFYPSGAPPWDSRPVNPLASLRSHGSRPRPTHHSMV